MKHFLISVSVTKADYWRKVEIVVFIASKTLWHWLRHLTWQSLVGKALQKSCKWLLFCSLILRLVSSAHAPQHKSLQKCMLFCFVITMMWWVQFEIADFVWTLAIFSRFVLTLSPSPILNRQSLLRNLEVFLLTVPSLAMQR